MNGWNYCFEKMPLTNVLCYVLVSGEDIEIQKSSYNNGHWTIEEWMKDYTNHGVIIAWKPIEKTILDEKEWLERHEDDIKEAFELTDIKLKEFAIAESFEECIDEYRAWFQIDRIRRIDEIFVIKVLW